MKILIADDHPVVRAGLKHHLQALSRVSIVEAASEAEALAAVSANDNLALVISDLIFGNNSADCFACLRAIRKARPEVPVIIFSVLESRDIVLQSIDLGAMGYIPKSLGEVDILSIVRRVLDGETWVPTQLMQRKSEVVNGQPSFGQRGAVQQLTERQREVFDLLSQGKSNRQIASMLGVSEHTIRVHMSAILRTLGLKNRTQAAILATQFSQPF